MTLKQLLNETYALGFEEGNELTDSFIHAANRALIRIVSELGAESFANVRIPKDQRELLISNRTLAKGEELTLTLYGAAYSITLSGKGSCEIISANTGSLTPFFGNYVIKRGFISDTDVITVRAESDVTVYELTVLKFTDAKSESEIPLFSDPRRIALSSVIPDFFRATAQPEDEYGNPTDCVGFTGDALYPKAGFCGNITVRYKRYPERISRDSQEKAIDVPRELETLLPLLTASYVWLDDDAERAQYYLELYLAEATRIKRAFPDSFASFRNVTGWA